MKKNLTGLSVPLQRRLPGNHNLKAPQGPTTGGNMESNYTVLGTTPRWSSDHPAFASCAIESVGET